MPALTPSGKPGTVRAGAALAPMGTVAVAPRGARTTGEPAAPSMPRPFTSAGSGSAPAQQAVPKPAHTHRKPAASAPQAEPLGEARRLADAGRLDEAEHAAQAFVNLNGTDAEAFYLLGLIADARGRSADASDYYRKTLYLEPAHYEALTHLAALLDMTGDSAAARQLLRRAQRAANVPSNPAAPPLNPPRGAHGPRRH